MEERHTDRDERIIQLFWARSEAAIAQTSAAYHAYCIYIADRILHNREDAEECVNDAYGKLWNLIPPHTPRSLPAFLGKIVRDLSIDRLRRNLAEKRGAADTLSILDEIGELAGREDPSGSLEDRLCLKDLINRFLAGLPREKRVMFVRRYWYMSDVREIARDLGRSEASVKTALARMRGELKTMLEKEGLA